MIINLIKIQIIYNQWLILKNKLLKLFKDKAHHWHDAHASFWSSETDEKYHQHDVNEWAKDDYHYLAEKFNQDKEYTREIEQAASTLWAQQT